MIGEGFVRWFTGIFLACLLFSAAAFAGENGGGNAQNVEPYFGSFSTSIPIEVPAYHGLEPKLALKYNSTGKNSFVGVGWDLTGISYIERGLPNGGSPRYDANDAYFFDGQELIPCTLQGGTHCTEIQSYLRIEKDTTNDIWYVTSTNGNRATYEPLFQTSKGTFRWYLTSVQDTHGNLVDYHYWDDNGLSIYLDHIAYNGITIKFYREIRSDAFNFATGAGLGKLRYRLKTVDVQVSGNRVRSNTLNYTTGISTQRSLLTDVKQYGKDAVVAIDGTVTGNSLPGVEMLWPESGGGFSENVLSIPGGYDLNNYIFLPGDYNGDGKTDWFMYKKSDGQYQVLVLSSGTGFTTNVLSVPGGYDLNNYSLVPGDYNGDGKTDWFMYKKSDGQYQALVLSSGTGFTTNVLSIPGGYDLNNYKFLPGDFNGDGKSDWFMYNKSDGRVHRLITSTGTEFIENVLSIPGDYDIDNFNYLLGDFNGDGKTDWFMYKKSNGQYQVLVYSTGTGFGTNVLSIPGGYDLNNYRLIPGDYNGDGRTDWFMYHTNGQTQRLISSAGTGFLEGILEIPGGYDLNNYNFLPGDYNGDGKKDWFIYQKSNGETQRLIASIERTDLLTSITNSNGGTTTVEYTPSSEWNNTYLPVGMILQTASRVTVNDGLGSSSVTDYSYEGGLWSDKERRFLGFRKATAALDDEGNYTETYYLQEEGSTSKPEYIYYRNNLGQIFHYSKLYYTPVGSTAPYASLLTDKWDYVCNFSDNCREIYTQYGYDQYGNILSTTEWGDNAVSGDERYILRGYFPNTGNYLVGLPAYENTYAGTNTSGQLLAQYLYHYDGNKYNAIPTIGNLTKVRKWNSNTGGYVLNKMEYDQYGNVVRKVDELGNATTYTYDPVYHLYPESECNALIQCSSTTWNTLLGLVASVSDINGVATTSTYDVFGRPATVTDPVGTVTNFTYANLGDPANQYIEQTVTASGGSSLWARTYQDGLGRDYQTIKSGNITQEVFFEDATNRVIAKSLAYEPGETPMYIHTEYDAVGRTIKIINPDATYSTIEYRITAEGEPYSVTYDELGHEKQIWKDVRGNVTLVKEKINGQYLATTYEYDLLGNPVRITDSAGNITTSTWDSLGRKLSTTDVDMGTWNYTYDNGGRLLTQTDARGKTTTFTYDVLGRMTLTTNDDGEMSQYFYDENGYGASIGRLTRSVYPGGSESHIWDERGFETQTTRCVDDGASEICKTIGQAYDGLGRVESITYPDGEIVLMNYDNIGRLSGMETVSGESYVDNLTWSTNDQLLGMEFGNGTSVVYTYDPSRLWLSSAQVKGPTNNVLYVASYTYDDANRMTASTSTTNPLYNNTYGYDDLNRLTSVTGGQNQTFAYDSLGNITSNSDVGIYQYNSSHAHAVTSAGSDSFSYDANGNMTSGGGRTFAWNADNRLAAVTKNGQTTTFVYDQDGNRVKKAGPNGTNYYFGSLVELESDGTLTKYYYAGPVLIAKTTGTETTWYHSDHLGSTRLMTDADGSPANEYDYAAFGKKILESTSVVNSRGFTGHTEDPDIGLIYMKARYYDATLGRFISPDTIVQDPTDPQSLNRYSYARNNPLMFTDPTGHFFGIDDIIVGAIVGAVIGGTSAEINGGNFWDGALSGAISGAIMGGVGAYVNTANYVSALDGFYTATSTMMTPLQQAAIYGTAGASIGAINSAIAGTDIFRGALNGAFSGATNGFIGGYFCGDFGAGRVFSESLAGGISSELRGGDFFSGALHSAGRGMLTFGNWAAREYEMSGGRSGGLGPSFGIFGLYGKLAGTRPLADGVKSLTTSWFNFGDEQSKIGKIGIFGHDFPYSGAMDTLVEAFAGPHDFLNGRAFGMYNSSGQYSRSTLWGQRFDQVINVLNVPVAAPFALSGYAAYYGIQ